MVIPFLESSSIEVVGLALHDSDACTVHRARLPSMSQVVGPLALKRIKISNSAAFERYERERAVLERADHPGIVRPLFIIQDPPCYALLLPLAERGSLSDILHRVGSAPLSAELALCWGYDLACALHYLHEQLGMLHRDVSVYMYTNHIINIYIDREKADTRITYRRYILL